MTTRTYQVEITGVRPMLMHWDNIEWSDQMDEWKLSPENKKLGKAGDDRSPAHRWIGSLYHDFEHVVIPSDNISRCLMEGGAMVPVPGGKHGKTFKSQSQSGMMIGEESWQLLVKGKPIPVKRILDLVKEDDFKKHKTVCASLGFALFVKRAKIGMAKHIRVRPRFDNWSATGTIIVHDDQITESALFDIARYGGQYKGLGDWRPGGKTPGPHGMFTATVKQI